MGKVDANKKNDADVLRAKDVIPPYNKNVRQEQKQSVKENISQDIESKKKVKDILPGKPEDTIRQKVKIPKFDLANQIMSEQRKVASIKRKAPNKKTSVINLKQKVGATGYAIKPPLILPQQEQIIVEIVKRDIQKLQMK